MARKIRVFFKDIPHLIYLKSINNIEAFKDIEDCDFFLNNISHLKSLWGIELHFYVIKKNEFYLVISPKEMQSISKFMQSLGRRYVRYYNDKYNRAGTIWEGRYKSSPIQDKYFKKVLFFLEVMKKNSLCEIREDIISFDSLKKYKLNYIDIIDKYQIQKKLSKEEEIFIKDCINKQNIIGNKSYIKELEKKVGFSLMSKKRGRPKKKQNNKGSQMYKKLVVLDKEKHKDIKVKPLQDLGFAKNLAYIPLVAGEVELVAKNFPVVFTKDETPSIVAIVALGNSSSLAINSKNKWITNYVPLYLRKYPFTLASVQDKNAKVLMIDEESELVSKEEGMALFDENGEHTEVLKHAVNFLKNYDKYMNITKNITKLIAEQNILEDREISVGEGDESKILVEGFRVINKEKLYGLGDDILADWVRKGIISVLENHIKSLENIDTLFKLAMQRQNI